MSTWSKISGGIAVLAVSTSLLQAQTIRIHAVTDQAFPELRALVSTGPGDMEAGTELQLREEGRDIPLRKAGALLEEFPRDLIWVFDARDVMVFKPETFRGAFREVLQNHSSAKDRSGLLVFGGIEDEGRNPASASRVSTLLEPTSDRSRIDAALESFRPRGMTDALPDAIGRALDLAAREPLSVRRRVVVVLLHMEPVTVTRGPSEVVNFNRTPDVPILVLLPEKHLKNVREDFRREITRSGGFLIPYKTTMMGAPDPKALTQAVTEGLKKLEEQYVETRWNSPLEHPGHPERGVSLTLAGSEQDRSVSFSVSPERVRAHVRGLLKTSDENMVAVITRMEATQEKANLARQRMDMAQVSEAVATLGEDMKALNTGLLRNRELRANLGESDALCETWERRAALALHSAETKASLTAGDRKIQEGLRELEGLQARTISALADPQWPDILRGVGEMRKQDEALVVTLRENQQLRKELGESDRVLENWVRELAAFRRQQEGLSRLVALATSEKPDGALVQGWKDSLAGLAPEIREKSKTLWAERLEQWVEQEEGSAEDLIVLLRAVPEGLEGSKGYWCLREAELRDRLGLEKTKETFLEALQHLPESELKGYVQLWLAEDAERRGDAAAAKSWTEAGLLRVASHGVAVRPLAERWVLRGLNRLGRYRDVLQRVGKAGAGEQSEEALLAWQQLSLQAIRDRNASGLRECAEGLRGLLPEGDSLLIALSAHIQDILGRSHEATLLLGSARGRGLPMESPFAVFP